MKNQTLTHKKVNVLLLAQLAILLALEAVMTFTPIGFILMPTGAIALLHIPVIIGAILTGPVGGGVLGLGFGIFSMIKASTSASPFDILFNPAASGNPIGSIVLCILPRVLLGVFAGVLYIVIKKFDKKKYIAIIASAAISTALHTTMVLGSVEIFFADFGVKEIITILLFVNALIEICLAVVLSTAICKPLFKLLKKA